MEFEEYYKSLELNSYPFSIYNSEGEVKKGIDLYEKPANYSIINEGLNDSSVIIAGERGSGKTALNLEVCRNKKQSNTILIEIDEFSNLELNYSTEQLYTFLTEYIAGHFFTVMSENQNSFWKYSKEERVDLSMFLHKYVRASSKALLTEKIKNIQNSLLKKIGLSFYNTGRVVLNYGLKAATKTVSDSLFKHFSSLPEFDIGNLEYFQKIESEVDQSFTPDERSFFYLNKLCQLILKSKIKEIIIVIDKIDEDPRFNNDAEPIASFIKGIASDNKVMVNNFFRILLFTWSTPFNAIKPDVRTQKLILQPLTWNNTSLEAAANKRVSGFSSKKITNIKAIFEEESFNELEKLYEMSNENPRDLWHLIDRCLKAQFNIDPSKKITIQAMKQGIEDFVMSFNYYEYYPKKSNARANTMDIYAYVKHLLKLDDFKFTKNQLNTMAQTGSSTNGYVLAMENMGLIRKTRDKMPGGHVIYQIKDPKIKYALSNNIDIEK